MLEIAPVTTDIIDKPKKEPGESYKVSPTWFQWFDRLRTSINSGFIQFVVIPTASLPAAGSLPPGTVIIEDAGSDVYNYILYAKTHRYRQSGGVSF